LARKQSGEVHYVESKSKGARDRMQQGSVRRFNLISSSELAVGQLASVQPSGKAVEDTIAERNHQ
jgi:hypothetical protein